MILAVVFPPFAVIDKGCGTYLIAFFLTCLGWIPGVVYAFVVLKLEQRNQDNKGHQVSKLQGKATASSSANAKNRGASSLQSPFDRKRRMSNNNQSGGWQGW